MGKCPKCEKICGDITVEEVTLSAGIEKPKWKGKSYICPHCKTILSVSVSPLSFRNDLVAALTRKLKAQN